MDTTHIFPISIYKGIINEISSEEINLYKSTLTNENFIKKPDGTFYTKTQTLLNNKVFVNLKQQILNISKIYLQSLSHVFKDLQIANSWGVYLKKNTESKDFHCHKNSYISGVFYLTEGSDIMFKNPLLNNWFFYPEFDVNFVNKSKISQVIYNISPKEKQLLLFPSFLDHNIQFNKIDSRMSIAFNVIPKGEFGYNTQKLFL